MLQALKKSLENVLTVERLATLEHDNSFYILCVISQTLCHFTYYVLFYKLCVILQTVCHFTNCVERMSLISILMSLISKLP